MSACRDLVPIFARNERNEGPDRSVSHSVSHSLLGADFFSRGHSDECLIIANVKWRYGGGLPIPLWAKVSRLISP